MDRIRGRMLAIDFGSHRIGVAVSDPLGITAQQLPAIRREGDRKDIEAIASLADAYGADSVLIGLPLLPSGTEGTQAAKVRKFMLKVQERLGLPVIPWDERFTTVQAERHLIEAGMRREKRKDVRDSLSAALLLQSALDARNRK
ncbi:MAG: Holliday junction resolvase RuvX [Deltaproteobacteria bacterium]|nr:Holliday junction resolvase RuvX [Deltaproteobacteria bacterium]PWB66539.1 MAG: Holliday junction resolvase RuvX [Deltaproteobacteria bacterium]